MDGTRGCVGLRPELLPLFVCLADGMALKLEPEECLLSA